MYILAIFQYEICQTKNYLDLCVSVSRFVFNLTMDINFLRDEFESNTEWRLRRQFLETNIDSLPLDRLVCLSRCFINMTLYGCSYPTPVMIEVQERGRGLVEEVEAGKKAQKKQEYSQSFVNSS